MGTFTTNFGRLIRALHGLLSLFETNVRFKPEFPLAVKLKVLRRLVDKSPLND